MTDYIIRDLNQEDLYGVLHFCKKFYRKAEFESLGKLDQNKTLQFLVDHLQSNESLMKVVEVDGDIEGFACFSVAANPFSHTSIAYEIFFWLDNKNPFAAKKIIKEYESWAKAKGCAAVRFGSIASLGDTRFNKFIKSMGFEKKETSFIKGV